MFTSQISRDEVRSAIEDKLCAHFAVTAKTATDDQVFQASAIVIREIMSRLLAVEETRCPTARYTICPWSSSWDAAS